MQFKNTYIIIFLLFNQFFLKASDISGKVTLENQQIHSDISVRFEAISNSASTDEVLTNAEGEYNLQLENGMYKLIISKDGFTSLVLDEIFIDSDSTLGDFQLLERGEKQISGMVSGIFYKDTTYYVTGDLIVDQNEELLIQPGTHLKFDGRFEIRVYGRIIAKGAENDSILFTSNKSNKDIGDWKGINISGSDTSKISYSILEYGGSPALISVTGNANIIVNNSRIEYSDRGGIYLQGSNYGEVENNKVGFAENTNIYFSTGCSGYIRSNYIHNGAVRGIYHENANIEVSGNKVSDCYAGIWTLTTGTINNNVVMNCNRGIYFFEGTNNLLVTNNTLINNTYGIGVNDESGINARVLNNIFYNNTNGIGYPWDVVSEPSIVSYNLFYQNETDYESSLSGFLNIITENANGTPSDTYYNIFEDPLLYLPGMTEPYHGAIKEYSPAIGAGSQGSDIGAFSFDNIAPAAFSIISNEIIQYDYDSVNIDIVWEESVDHDQKAEAPYYNIYFMQEDTVFQTKKIASTSFQFNNTDVLDQNTDYDINIISSDGLSYTEANELVSFTTPNLAPSAFQIVDLEIVNTDNFNTEISIGWTPNLDTDDLTYSVMVGNNGNFENIGETSEDSIVVVASLIENTNYECFIVADDGQLSTFSDTTSFITPNSPPSEFQLILPQNDSVLFERHILFSWEESTDQSNINYQITIYNSHEKIKINDIETNQYSLNTVENLNPSSEYLWFVSATDGVDTTYSMTRRFSTDKVLSVESSKILDFKLYPNPASSELILDVPFIGNVSYKIFDLKGKLLNHSKLNRNRTVDVSNLSNGVYHLIIRNEKDDNVGVARFVKK